MEVIGLIVDGLPSGEHGAVYIVEIVCFPVLIEPARVICAVTVVITCNSVWQFCQPFCDCTVFLVKGVILTVHFLQAGIFAVFFGNVIVSAVPDDPAERDLAGNRIVEIPLSVYGLPSGVQ